MTYNPHRVLEMGFKDVRCLLIDALESGRCQHE